MNDDSGWISQSPPLLAEFDEEVPEFLLESEDIPKVKTLLLDTSMCEKCKGCYIKRDTIDEATYIAKLCDHDEKLHLCKPCDLGKKIRGTPWVKVLGRGIGRKPGKQLFATVCKEGMKERKKKKNRTEDDEERLLEQCLKSEHPSPEELERLGGLMTMKKRRKLFVQMVSTYARKEQNKASQDRYAGIALRYSRPGDRLGDIAYGMAKLDLDEQFEPGMVVYVVEDFRVTLNPRSGKRVLFCLPVANVDNDPSFVFSPHTLGRVDGGGEEPVYISVSGIVYVSNKFRFPFQ